MISIKGSAKLRHDAELSPAFSQVLGRGGGLTFGAPRPVPVVIEPIAAGAADRAVWASAAMILCC